MRRRQRQLQRERQRHRWVVGVRVLYGVWCAWVVDVY